MNAKPPSAAPSIELTYDKQCPGMPQGRSANVSSLTAELTITDEAGEARLIHLTPEKIAALVAALRKAKLDTLTSAPGASKARCTIKLHAVIDGAVKELEESPATAVNDAAAWAEVQTVIETLAGWR